MDEDQYTIDYFKASIGSGVIPPIERTVLGHTLGEPKSYPASAQKDALPATYFPNDSSIGKRFWVVDYWVE